MKRSFIVEIICFLFIVLFLYTAGTKLTGYNTFVAQMGKSPLLTNYAGILAWLVPAIEIITAVLLMVPRTRLYGMYISFAMMVLFTLYVGAILSFSKELPCSCGGVISSLGWWQHLVFNTAFAVLGYTGMALLRKQAAQTQTA